MIKFEWEEIYNRVPPLISYCEFTYRAKVPGGWLIRHETHTDYQYDNPECDDESIKHIHDEGYQNIGNVLTFVADPDHQWKVEYEG